MSKIILGAPSLSGKDASELVAKAVEGLSFPLKVTVTNLVDHGLSFPEIEGLYMTGKKESRPDAIVEIKNLDEFERLSASFEQIAEVNRHEFLVEIEIHAEVVVDLAGAETEVETEVNTDSEAEAEVVVDADSGADINGTEDTLATTGKKTRKPKVV